MKYHRILLKMSGKAFAQSNGSGLDIARVGLIAQEIKSIHEMGVEIGIVVGSSNFVQPNDFLEKGVDRTTTDYIGLLGTVMNSLTLMDVLEREGIQTRVMSAIEIKSVTEPYIRRRAIDHLQNNRVVLFSGGTGNPYFSTDTVAALRATEIGADIVINFIDADGIQDGASRDFILAKRYREVSNDAFQALQLRIMDSTAISLALKNELPILVVNLRNPYELMLAVQGESIGTLIYAVENSFVDKFTGDSTTDAPPPEGEKKKRRKAR